jgi:hypothetical protein
MAIRVLTLTAPFLPIDNFVRVLASTVGPLAQRHALPPLFWITLIGPPTRHEQEDLSCSPNAEILPVKSRYPVIPCNPVNFLHQH